MPVNAAGFAVLACAWCCCLRSRHGGLRLPAGCRRRAGAPVEGMPGCDGHARVRWTREQPQLCKAHCEHGSQTVNAANGRTWRRRRCCWRCSTGRPRGAGAAGRIGDARRTHPPARHRPARRRCTSPCSSFATSRPARAAPRRMPGAVLRWSLRAAVFRRTRHGYPHDPLRAPSSALVAAPARWPLPAARAGLSFDEALRLAREQAPGAAGAAGRAGRRAGGAARPPRRCPTRA